MTRPRLHFRRLPGRRALPGLALLCAAAIASTVGSAPAASGNAVVSLTVISATNLSIDPADTAPAGNCLASSAGTSFGTVQPGTPNVTTTDCSIVFGSSNDTAMLRVAQLDGLGTAMWRGTMGAVETTFNGGTRATDIGASTNDGITSAVFQPDGKLIVVGITGSVASPDGFMARYTTAGALDTTFGCAVPPCSGKVIQNISSGDEEGMWDLRLLPDGRIVVFGDRRNDATTRVQHVLSRFLPNGTYDTTFGCSSPPCLGYSLSTANPAGNTDYGAAMDMGLDGRIVSVGVGREFPGTASYDATIHRYTSDGVLDPTFGSGGTVLQGFSDATGQSDGFQDVAVRPDGRIVAVGNAVQAGNTDWLVAQYTTAGVLDTNFGCATPPCSGYRRIAATAGPDYAKSVDVQPNGKIIVGGSNSNNGVDGLLARLNANGTDDTTFSTNGWLTLGMGAASDEVEGARLHPDGSIIVAQQDANSNQFVLHRITSGGVIDTNFGTNGTLTASAGAGAEGTSGFAFGPDGSIAIVGDTANASKDAAIAVFKGLQVPDYGGGNDWVAGASGMFGACLRSVSGGATTDGTTWTPDGDADCADGNADPWKPIVVNTSTAGAKVAQVPTGTTSGRVNLRFGLRTPASQAPGTYVAPIAVEIVAPTA